MLSGSRGPSAPTTARSAATRAAQSTATPNTERSTVSDEPAEGDEDTEYDEPCESGPFCRHYGDPADCDILCARCGHRCARHEQGGDDESECRGAPYDDPPMPDCPCPAWVEPEENEGQA